MTNSPFKKVTHCIFDMDGLLLDTETLYTEAFQRIVKPYGKEFTWDLKAQIMGFKTNEVACAMVDRLKLPITPTEFQEQAQKLFEELFPHSKLMPGAKRLICHLKENNVPIALATSSSTSSYELKTQNWEKLFELFHHKVISGSDPSVKRGKPYPDIFLIAKSRFPDDPDPSTCLVFEDAPNGVKAGVGAGMQVVMVPDSHLPKHLTKEATLVLNSLEDFKPEQFGLPPFSK